MRIYFTSRRTLKWQQHCIKTLKLLRTTKNDFDKWSFRKTLPSWLGDFSLSSFWHNNYKGGPKGVLPSLRPYAAKWSKLLPVFATVRRTLPRTDKVNVNESDNSSRKRKVKSGKWKAESEKRFPQADQSPRWSGFWLVLFWNSKTHGGELAKLFWIFVRRCRMWKQKPFVRAP